MVCTTNDLHGWENFPKGLRVLLLDEHGSSAAEIKPKLEAMDYIVTTFCSENEALSAITNGPESFHLAIVEVNESCGESHFKFLENAKDLPTIMTSHAHSLSTMMKCIALGAVEFMQKPLSDDKLQNIWQHVVHKAFNSGASGITEPLKPVKESVVTMLQLLTEDQAHMSGVGEMDNAQSTGNDRYHAPSTPQLKQGTRFIDNGDHHDHNNCSTEKDAGEEDGVCKSFDSTGATMNVEGSFLEKKPTTPGSILVKEEEDLADTKSDNEVYAHSQDEKVVNSIITPSKASIQIDSKGNKANWKKMKVDWSPELHKKFVRAVEQLGLDQAIPSRILELMKVEGLTRHHVASHLQKYRMHKRHILPKEDDRKWLHQRDQKQKCYNEQGSIMAYPHYYSNPTLPAAHLYPMWRQSANYTGGVQICGPHGYPFWQPQESWIWKPSPGLHADAWGCPVLPPSSYPQNALGFRHRGVVDFGSSMLKNSFQINQAEEEIDKAVKEAISKPWLPLPLGLNPPCTDSVLAELSKEGFSDIPPPYKQMLHD